MNFGVQKKLIIFSCRPVNRIASPEARDAFGIIVSYAVKVKLFLGALGGELCAELPFILMQPKVGFHRYPKTRCNSNCLLWIAAQPQTIGNS